MTSLSDTIADLQVLTEPSREMDARIAIATDDPQIRGATHTGGGAFSFRIGEYIAAPSYTASIDAAIALAERVLPSAVWSITSFKPISEQPGLVDARAYIELVEQEGRIVSADAATPAIAILIATLTALDKEG